MKHTSDINPPRWAQRFLEWYCRPELLEDLQGDLNEYFRRNLKTKSPARARFIYILDVLKFFRLYTVRKPEFINLLINWIMIGSYIKASGRNIVRNKLSSAINIIGLTVSMSVGLLVISMVSDLISYDNFHEKKARIYRVNTRDQQKDHSPINLASSSIKAGKIINETINGIESMTLIRRGFSGDATTLEKSVPVSGLLADQYFFNVFTFPFLYGDPSTALKDPYSLVLTEQSAIKIFGHTDVLGEALKFDTASYFVTGVLKDIPKLSHMKFELLISLSTTELIRPDTDGDLLSWKSIYMNYIYLVLPENSDRHTVQVGLDKLSVAENASLRDRSITLFLQPLGDIPLTGGLENSIGPVFNKIALWILGGLAVVIVLSACFNYTNLSIARSFRRSREIGIRKVVGAAKNQVVIQFIAEAILIALLALVFSFLLFLFLRTELLSLHPFLSNRFVLTLSFPLIFSFIGFALAVGIIAGFFPALFFSRINASTVLKDASSFKIFKHIGIRKALIVVQYTFSLIFITATIIGYTQYKNFITFDLGFTTENILNIWVDGTDADAIIKELSELPEVHAISRSRIVTSIGSIYGSQMTYKNDSAGVWQNMVDENYLPLHHHQILAGRNFNPKKEDDEEREVIVNEQVLKRFGMEGHNPDEILGENITIDNKKLMIVGIVKDFHYGTLENKIQPMLFRHVVDKDYGFINAKIQTQDWPATLKTLEKAWKRIDQVHPLQATFYDDQIEQAYSQFSVMLKVIGFLAFLAVCIATMGLFGMVVFATETRLKEISIRKVMGASNGTLMILLSKGFLFMLVLSSTIALPLTYFFFNNVVLTQFAYHQSIAIGEVLNGASVVMVLAFLMIGSQTLRAARSNPADVLKAE